MEFSTFPDNAEDFTDVASVCLRVLLVLASTFFFIANNDDALAAFFDFLMLL